MTIQEALRAELTTAFPEIPNYYMETGSTDECPPYFVVVCVDGATEFPAGRTGRWQITGSDTDPDALDARMEQVIGLFHYKQGDFGGRLIASVKCILEVGPVKNEAGIYEKHIDLEIFYRKEN